jgi:hypothetical protein
MAETTVRISPKRMLGMRIQVLQKQILALEQFLKSTITGKKQLKELEKYITNDGLYLTYSDIIAPKFEKIIVDDVFYIIRQQLQKCREELTDLVTEAQQYE